MGSLVYARQLKRDHVEVSAIISLEMLGYYSDAPSSQKYPSALGLFYSSRGDFIGFVGKSDSPDLVRRALRGFRETTSFPSEGVAAPAEWPGVGWSDHWSFWQSNYPAIMITDTAIFRNPYYHTPNDTADKLGFRENGESRGLLPSESGTSFRAACSNQNSLDTNTWLWYITAWVFLWPP